MTHTGITITISLRRFKLSSDKKLFWKSCPNHMINAVEILSKSYDKWKQQRTAPSLILHNFICHALTVTEYDFCPNLFQLLVHKRARVMTISSLVLYYLFSRLSTGLKCIEAMPPDIKLYSGRENFLLSQELISRLLTLNHNIFYVFYTFFV